MNDIDDLVVFNPAAASTLRAAILAAELRSIRCSDESDPNGSLTGKSIAATTRQQSDEAQTAKQQHQAAWLGHRTHASGTQPDCQIFDRWP